jgi:hypothetical protein
MPGTSRSDPVLAALVANGASIRRIRYRTNRSVLLSVSRDGRTLNSHHCFRDAPPAVVAAIVAFVRSPRASARWHHALTVIRGWEGAQRGIEEARRGRPPRTAAPGPVGERVRLEGMYDRLNRERFGGWLPPVHLRVSRRMTRSLGTITYGRLDGDRAIRAITIAADLFLPGNETVLEDTVLHEMAHGEAWLRHGHRGHGSIWRRIAARVGCSPRARTEAAVRRAR